MRVASKPRRVSAPVTTSDEPKPAPAAPASSDRKAAIVTIKRPGKRYADIPDMTPEEHKRRGDAADAVWRELGSGPIKLLHRRGRA